MLGSHIGLGLAPELHPDVRGVWKKCEMTNFTMPNNVSSMKYTLKSVSGLADVGVFPLGWGWPQNSTQMYGGVWKNFQMTNFDMLNNVS